MRGECVKTNEQKYKEYLGLYKKYPNVLIKEKLKINDKILLKFLTKAVRESVVEADEQIIFSEKEPFSENEMEYGTNIKWPKQFENTVIKEAEVTELKIAIVTYKLQFKK